MFLRNPQTGIARGDRCGRQTQRKDFKNLCDKMCQLWEDNYKKD